MHNLQSIVEEIQIPVGTRQRRAILVRPCLMKRDPTPLVVAYHGGQSHPEAMRRFSGLDCLAESGGAIVVYPFGTGTREGLLTWNGGNCCGEAFGEDSDDVTFTKVLVENLINRFGIDRGYIFATGMSNGAMMAYRVGAELADMFSAIAPVSGPLALLDIAPSREISVVHFHGSLDQFTPLDGGIGRRSVTRVSHRGILAGLLDFVRTNGCPPDPIRETICENQDGISIERYSWGPGKLLSSVVFYRIEGGGHTWPGQKPDSFFLGNTSLSLSANTIMLEFFLQHARHLRKQDV